MLMVIIMPTAKRKTRKRNKKTTVKLFIGGSVFLVLFFLLETQLKPTITSMSSYFVKQYATEQITEAVNETLNDQDLNYDDIVNLTQGADGNIVSIQTRPQKITQIHTNILKKVNQRLANLDYQTIAIPLGSLSGITFLSGRGPLINVKMLPKGSVNSQIISSLQEAGINQTLHTVDIKITAQITSIIPLFSTTDQIECDCPIAQSVIVGNVPDYYTKVVSENSNDDPTNDISKYGNPRFAYPNTQ